MTAGLLSILLNIVFKKTKPNLLIFSLFVAALLISDHKEQAVY